MAARMNEMSRVSDQEELELRKRGNSGADERDEPGK